VYTIDLNLNNFVKSINSETGKQLLKENIDIFNNIQIKNTINIQGIGEGIIKSKGLAPIELQTDKYIIPYNFHIVNQDFAIPCDGIIGIDFIKELNYQINLNPTEDWFNIRPNNIYIHIIQFFYQPDLK